MFDLADLFTTSAALAGVQYRPPNDQYLCLDPKERYRFFDRQTFLDNPFSEPLTAHAATFQEYPGMKATIQEKIGEFLQGR